MYCGPGWCSTNLTQGTWFETPRRSNGDSYQMPLPGPLDPEGSSSLNAIGAKPLDAVSGSLKNARPATDPTESGEAANGVGAWRRSTEQEKKNRVH